MYVLVTALQSLEWKKAANYTEGKHGGQDMLRVYFDSGKKPRLKVCRYYLKALTLWCN
jgi:hypothetical protein